MVKVDINVHAGSLHEGAWMLIFIAKSLLVTLQRPRRDIEPHRKIRDLSGPETVLLDYCSKPVAVHRIKHPIHHDQVLADAQRLEVAERARPHSGEAGGRANPQPVAGRIDVCLLLPCSRIDHILDRHKLRKEILERRGPCRHEALWHCLEARVHEPARPRRSPMLARVDLITEGGNDLLSDVVKRVQIDSSRRDAVIVRCLGRLWC